MIPSIPIPTDSLYKFCCLTGLALAVSGTVAFFTSYAGTLDKEVEIIGKIAAAEALESPSALDKRQLDIYRLELETRRDNQRVIGYGVGAVIGTALSFFVYGIHGWRKHVQDQEDERLRLAVSKLKAEVAALSRDDQRANQHAKAATPGATEGTG